MKETVRQLVDLCELDREIHALSEQLARYPVLLKELDAREKKAAKEIESLHARLKQARDGRRKAELDADDLREKIRKYQIQQGNVKTNRELEAVTHEIEGLTAKVDELETFGLESLESEEKTQGALAGAEAAKTRLVAELDVERARIAEQTGRKKSEIDAHTAEQAVRAARLPEDVREMYALLNRKYPGTGVVPIKDGACGGCSMNLVKQRVTEVRRAERPVRCDNCTRILYDAAWLHAAD